MALFIYKFLAIKLAKICQNVLFFLLSEKQNTCHNLNKRLSSSSAISVIGLSCTELAPSCPHGSVIYLSGYSCD